MSGILALIATFSTSGIEPWTTEWIDSIWRDHKLERAARHSGQGIWEEAHYRDALRADPLSADAVERLAIYYEATSEPTLALGASLYGKILSPDRPVWSMITSRATQAAEAGPSSPAINAEPPNYREGLDRMLEHVLATNLLMAEVEVRLLLTQYPRDLRLIENLCTLARMAGESAIEAMHWLAYCRIDPSNFPAANNLAATLDRLGLPAAAADALAPFLQEHTANAYVMSNAILLNEAAGRFESAYGLAERWTAADPTSAEAWSALTRVALRTGRIEQARNAWSRFSEKASEQARAIALDHPVIREHLAVLGEHP